MSGQDGFELTDDNINTLKQKGQDIMKKTLCILLALLMVLSLFGCGANAKNKVAQDHAVEESYTAYSDMAGGSTMNYTADSKTDGIVPQAEKSLLNDRKIIYTAHINVETTDFEKGVTALENLVAKYGGYIANSDVSGNTQYSETGTATIVNRRGWYEVNIPAGMLDAFLEESGNVGNVTGKNKSSNDITEAYSDTEIRLETLRVEQQRLLELLAKADTIDAIIQIEDKLSQLSYEIESHEATKRSWDKQISFSSVTVNLREVELYTDVTYGNRSVWQRIGDSFVGGFKSFGRGIVNFFIELVYLLPYVIIIVAVVIAVIVIRKKRKKIAKTEN